MKKQTIRLINDHFQNYKVYGIPKAQLVISDIPYNLGANALQCAARVRNLAACHTEGIFRHTGGMR